MPIKACSHEVKLLIEENEKWEICNEAQIYREIKRHMISAIRTFSAYKSGVLTEDTAKKSVRHDLSYLSFLVTKTQKFDVLCPVLDGIYSHTFWRWFWFWDEWAMEQHIVDVSKRPEGDWLDHPRSGPWDTVFELIQAFDPVLNIQDMEKGDEHIVHNTFLAAVTAQD